PTHCISAEGELKPELGLQDGQLDLIDFHTEMYADMPPLLAPSPELSICPEPSTWGLFPPNPLSCLLPPSAHPQPTICAVGSPQVCQFPLALWLEDPSSPPPASESWTPPRPSDPAAPPRLLAPSSPLSPVGPAGPPGSYTDFLSPSHIHSFVHLLTPLHPSVPFFVFLYSA
ncbi:hypothetical protein M9458_016436, partial [Cirrhinus mrigala]